ncbi:hypothetical protein CMI41_00855 [Candidatus Pacearchaeota archaeon]|nr:hypothetical protein [Candidatus Pacearchaeota archaeon]|tara:strand:+ start:144 stop:638 length:495 start_codon:yes stop_codon:yes gene_type:complete
MFKKRGQQEIVGFALIVVLVVIGLMFFLLYSFRDSGNISENDLALGNLMSSVLYYTTDCSVGGEKQTLLDLFSNCHDGVGCENEDRTSCELLTEELEQVFPAVYKTESSVDGMTFDFYIDDELGISGVQGFEKVVVGNCTSSYSRSFEQAIGSLDDVYVLISVC